MRINKYLCANRSLRERLHALGIELTESVAPPLVRSREVAALTEACLETARRLAERTDADAPGPGDARAVFRGYLAEATPEEPFGDEHWELPRWSASLDAADADRAVENLWAHFGAAERDLLVRVCARGACSFAMPTSAKGGYMYVQAAVCPACDARLAPDAERCAECETAFGSGGPASERVTCQHPLESATVRDVLGPDAPQSAVDARTGFNSHCVCLDCLAQFDLDLDRDERRCPECDGAAVRSEAEMVGEACPNCALGVVTEQGTTQVT